MPRLVHLNKIVLLLLILVVIPVEHRGIIGMRQKADGREVVDQVDGLGEGRGYHQGGQEGEGQCEGPLKLSFIKYLMALNGDMTPQK